MSQKCPNVPVVTCFSQTFETGYGAYPPAAYWKVSPNPVLNSLISVSLLT